MLMPSRVQETTTTTGTGTISLAGAASQCQSFASGVGTGNPTTYLLLSGNGTDWEEGVGVVGGGSPYTLTRNPTRSTNSNAAISLSGTSIVFAAPVSDSIDPTFPLTSLMSSSTTTLAGDTVYPCSLSFPAVQGDIWRIRAAVLRPTSGSSSATLVVANSAGTSGYQFAYQNDGNLVVYSYYSGGQHVVTSVGGGNTNRGYAANSIVEAEIGIGNPLGSSNVTNNTVAFLSYTRTVVNDSALSFLSGSSTFQIGISCDSFADIGKVTLTKMN